MDWGSAFGAITGALGALGSNQKNRQAEEMMRMAKHFMETKGMGFDQAVFAAMNYDPLQEDAAGERYAMDSANRQLNGEMRRLNNIFKNGGGSPTGDTAFNVSAQGAADRVMDPLKLMMANNRSTATARKISALTQALGSGGNLAGDYMALASGSRSDPSGSLALLGSGLEGLFGKKKGKSSLVGDPLQSNASYSGGYGGGNA